MKHIFLFLIAIYLLGMTACNTTRIVKPLKEKEVAVGLDIGGPIVDLFGTKIPIPFSSLSVGYGIDSTFTMFAGAHITSAVFGTAQIDAGLVKEVLSPKGIRPGISVSPVANLLVDGFSGSFRAYPQVDVNLYWEYWKGKEHYFYLSWSSWFDFWPLAHNAPKEHVYFPSIAAGHTFENKKMRYTIEAKYMAPNISNQIGPVSYNGTGGQGAWGVYLSIHRKF